MKKNNTDCNVEIDSIHDLKMNTKNSINITEEELMELPKEVLQKMLETVKTKTQKKRINKILQGRVAKRLRKKIKKNQNIDAW